MIYEGEPGEESLSGIQTADGFIAWRGSAANSQMQYFLRDHLGSVRMIAADKNTVISRSDYLPFGVRMTGSGLNDGRGRSSYFGFSGKENEMWGGYDTADGDATPHWLKGERYQHFGARAYDPVTCTFMQIDPMAEKYYGMTPYHYCAGNPVMLVDPDGEVANYIIGALIGGVSNYMGQVVVNSSSGKSLKESLVTNIDWADVGVSTIEGALTSGSSALKKTGAKVLVGAISGAVQGGVDWSKDNGFETSVDGTLLGGTGGAIMGAMPSVETTGGFRKTTTRVSNNKAVEQASAKKGKLSPQEQKQCRQENNSKIKTEKEKNKEEANSIVDAVKTFVSSVVSKAVENLE